MREPAGDREHHRLVPHHANANIPAPHTAKIASSIVSSGVSVPSDIESLARTAERLSSSADVWTDWGLRALVVAGFFSLAVAGVQAFAAKKSRQATRAEKALGNAKEESLNRNLDAKDLQIAQLANESKDKDARIAELNIALIKLEERSGRRRLKLTPPIKAEVEEALSPFAGQKFALGVLIDGFEAKQLADDILRALEATRATWIFVGPRTTNAKSGLALTGVRVAVSPTADVRTQNAAAAVNSFLASNGMEPVLIPAAAGVLAPPAADVIKITIAARPRP